ncbi:MAG: nitrogen regulation protein NR(II) [Leptospirillia bacterium]
MTQIVRVTLILSLLMGLVLVVHQHIQVRAADYIITGALDTATATAEWNHAAEGTRLLLQLLGAGAVITLLVYYLRMLQGAEVRPRTSLEALAPLTAALSDVKAREATQRQQKRVAVARMQEVQASHATIVDGITSGVLTVDGNGNVATCNPAAQKILGWQGASPVSRPVHALFRGCPPPQLGDATPHARERRTEFLWHPQGRPPRTLGLSFSPIETPHGRLTAVLFTDLTEMIRLKHQVEMRRHLSQLGEVSAGIAHEFRNNMGAVMGYARLIGREVSENPAASEVVTAMMAELTDMEGLIRDLLSFSRTETLQPTEVAPGPLLEHVVEVAAAEFDVRVSVHVPPGLPALWVDESRVRQSLINLVRNACEAIEDDGRAGGDVGVSVEACAGDAPGVPPKWLAIRVRDSGPGIPEAVREKAFLPFFTTKENGTGMGLAHVNKTVTAHAGELHLADGPDGGAEITLRLPTVNQKSFPGANTEDTP